MGRVKQHVVGIVMILAVSLSLSGCGGGDDAPANQPPTAHAEVDQQLVDAGDTVTLDGSGSSDPDGSIASYQWTPPH